MSEPEQEPTEPVEEPQDEPSDDETAEEEERASRDEEEPEEPVEPEQPAEPEGLTEKQLEASRKTIVAENTRHHNRVSAIMGEEAQFLVPCPLCKDFVDGLIFPQVPPDDVVEATLAAVGLGDFRDLEQASDAAQCTECRGRGRTKTGAVIGEFASKKCGRCRGIGWTKPDGTAVLDEDAPAGAGDALVASNGSDPDVDPLVDALKARGWSVFPPMQLPAGA